MGRSAVLHPPILVPTSLVTECRPHHLLQKFEIAVSIDRLALAVISDEWMHILDFHFWGVAQQHVYREQPDNIEALIQCVSAFAATYDSGTIRKVSENVLKRAKQCSDVNGDHFQHLLK